MTSGSENVVWLPRYTARRVMFLDLWQDEGWSVKAYALTSRPLPPGPIDISAARRAFKSRLAWLARADANDPMPDMGFALCAFDAASSSRMRFCWWAEGGAALCTELIGWAGAPKPAEIVQLRGGDIMAEVDELRVIAFERDAWQTLVLHDVGSRGRPDVASYLSTRLHDDI